MPGGAWRQSDRGSKRRLKRLQRQVTRREIVLAVIGGIALLLMAALLLLSAIKHLEEHRR
jgi:hypothetical protein